MKFFRPLLLVTLCVWLALLGNAGCFPSRARMARMIGRLRTRLGKLESKIDHLQAEVGDDVVYSDGSLPLKDGRLSKRSPGSEVAFSVALDKSAIVPTGSRLPFDNILTNIGGHYSANNNEFVAPLTGTYLFTLNAVCGKYSYMHLAVYQNETPVFRSLCDNRNGSSQQQSGGITPLLLTQGDRVSVRMVYPLATSSEAYGNGMTSFSGFLLQ